MKLELLDKNGLKLEIKNIDKVMSNISILENLIKNNPTTGFKDKITSLAASETFSTLFTEGEISSRRQINSVIKNRFDLKDSNIDKYIASFWDAFIMVLGGGEFSISRIFNVYSTVSKYGIADEDKLEDGEMFRNDVVYIASNKLNKEYTGYSADKIKESLVNLCNFLNDNEDGINLFVKAIIGHFYFEIIHPYYDYNGRTGRLIPIWLFSNHGRQDQMLYFSTAIGNYRETYISLFRNSIDSRTFKIDLDLFINGIINLLILNQRQYIWFKALENKYIDKTNKRFSQIQKSFIWMLMIKAEKQYNSSSWNKLTSDDLNFIEKDLLSAQLSRDTNQLADAGIIRISDTKPVNYKLIGYELLRND